MSRLANAFRRARDVGGGCAERQFLEECICALGLATGDHFCCDDLHALTWMAKKKSAAAAYLGDSIVVVVVKQTFELFDKGDFRLFGQRCFATVKLVVRKLALQSARVLIDGCARATRRQTLRKPVARIVSMTMS